MKRLCSDRMKKPMDGGSALLLTPHSFNFLLKTADAFPFLRQTGCDDFLTLQGQGRFDLCRCTVHLAIEWILIPIAFHEVL